MVHRVEFLHVPATVARYRVHPGQTMSQRKERAEKGRRQIRHNLVARISHLQSEDPSLYSYYVNLTERFRRLCAPALPVGRSLALLPKAGALAYWTERLAPRWTSIYYWASNPPIVQIPSQH